MRDTTAAWLVSGGLREKVLPARVVCVWTGLIFSLLALNGPKWAFFAVLGEFCTGLALRRGLLGEFCTGLALRSGLLGEFCTGECALRGSSPVEWCNRFVSFGVGYALSWSGGSSCWVGWGVSRDLVRMSRLR